MPKDTWRTSSSAYRNAVRRGKRDDEGARLAAKARRKKARRLAKVFMIPAGTRCWVRRRAPDAWRRHTTRLPVVNPQFVWQNQKVYGFVHQGWEIKIARELVQRLSERL